jgi:hypothetical protein
MPDAHSSRIIRSYRHKAKCFGHFEMKYQFHWT